MAKQQPPAKKQAQQKPVAKKQFSISEYQFPILIFLFAFLLYSNTLHHGFVMDDGAMIANHTTVQKGFKGIKELFGQSSVYGSTKENFGTYRPLTMSLFALEKQFFGNNSSAFHFVQVLLYAVLCVVIFVLLKKLFVLTPPHPQPLSHRRGEQNPAGEGSFAFIATLLFAAHPIHTEVVANIKSADEILSFLFCSLSLLFAIKFAEVSSKKYLGITFIFFLCALFSKESAATFIFIIPLALYFFVSGSGRSILTVTIVHVLAILIYFLTRNFALDKAPEGISIINNALAGTHSFSERYATIFVILLQYLKLLFYPHPLCWDYGYNQIPIVSFSNPMAIVSLLIYLTLGIFAILILFKRKIPVPNTQYSILFSFCTLFFLISLSVSSNVFVLIGSTMAERFLFTPSLAFCILLAFGLIKIFKIEFTNIKLIPLLIILAMYSYKTFSRNKDWQTNLTLFAKDVETCPNSYRTNITYAWESVLAGEKETNKEKKKIYLQNAVTYYQKGLAIYDKVDADWYNYGVSNSNLNNVEEALKAYRHALSINPKHLKSSYNLATIYLSRKDFSNSLKYFLMAYQSDSAFMDVPFKIGLNYHFTGDLNHAVFYYEKQVKLQPDNKDAISNLVLAYKSLENKEKEDFYLSKLKNLR